MLARHAMFAAALTPPAPIADSLTPRHAAVPGAIQGVTESLPISSNAHLYAVPEMLGWKYEGVAFGMALHRGTLLALLAAFWRDWFGRADFGASCAYHVAFAGVIVAWLALR